MAGSSSVEDSTKKYTGQKLLTLSLSVEATNDYMFTLLPFSEKSCHDASVMHFPAFKETLLLKNIYIWPELLTANQLR